MNQNPFLIRQVTTGPKYHWFGYYDKMQFDPSGQFLLGMEVTFEHRRPSPEDTIVIGMVDLLDNNEWIELGTSRAWCWQSGCMLQWIPNNPGKIIWNDRKKDRFISHILNIHTREHIELDFPVFTLHPDGITALGLDFERLEYMRPGYGYCGIQDRNQNKPAPDSAGIYTLNLQKGTKDILLSLAQVSQIRDFKREFKDSKHYFNCLLFNPAGTDFVFLHRWRDDFGKGWPFRTRMFSAKADGSQLEVLVPGGCGHFNWKDNHHLIVQEDGFWIYQIGQGRKEQLGKSILPGSGGHVSFFPGSDWLVGDTYPDQKRDQILYLYNFRNSRFLEAGRFHSPLAYTGARDNHVDDEWRCDLHPRISTESRKICFDSVHTPQGRQMYLMDVSTLIV